MAEFTYIRKNPSIDMQFNEEKKMLKIIVREHGLEQFHAKNMPSIIFEMSSNRKNVSFGDVFATQDGKALYVEQPRAAGYYLVSVDNVKFSSSDIMITVPVILPKEDIDGEVILKMNKPYEYDAYGMFWDGDWETELNLFWLNLETPMLSINSEMELIITKSK